MGNPFHREDGRFGNRYEHHAYLRGITKGIARGIVIGVEMAARALAVSLSFVWRMIYSSKRKSA